MKNIKYAVAVLALAAMAGCTGGANGLLNTAAGALTASASPGTTTGTTATGTNTTGTTATTGSDAASCTRTLGDYSTGTSEQGAFNGQRLPAGWDTQLTSEDAVYNAIDNLYQNDWPCFQKFYPGASSLYKTKRGL